MRPLLLLEINEVPWRVIDKFKSYPSYPAIKEFFSKSSTYTTLTVDKPGMLDPWVTWPSLHRGMDNTTHNVKNLGQDPATFRGTPIWEEFRRKGMTIGVFGSLQSWPPKDPGIGGFYVPDTFAHDEKCIPSFIEPFQKFNLGQVSTNGRVIRGKSLLSLSSFRMLASLPRLGISFRSLRMISVHLLCEIWDKSKLARRPIFQTVLFWDLFKSLFNPSAPPAFSTFFTNHVASIMHRWWKHIFPEDFVGLYRDEPKVHMATMEFSMDVLEKILSDAMGFCHSNQDLILVFASSMGQEAIIHEWHQGYEASVPYLEKLMNEFGVKVADYKPLLAMVPQVAVQINDAAIRDSFKKNLGESLTESGQKLFVVLEEGNSLSITILTPRLEDIRAGRFRMATEGGPGYKTLEWNEAGISMNPVEPGTAYHFPEGILAVYGKGIAAKDERREMMADEVKDFLIGLTNLRKSGSDEC